jgi:hypothetical protein
VNGGFGNNVGVEAVAEIDRVDIVTAHNPSQPSSRLTSTKPQLVSLGGEGKRKRRTKEVKC